MRRILGVSIVVVLSACGCSNPTAPTRSAGSSPSAAVFGLTGGVFDPGGHPIAQARLEVLDGLRKGTVAVTDDAGAFAFDPIFTSPFMLRASKEGRHDESKLISTAQSDSSFTLGFDLAGTYEVTFAADAACTDLPAAVRTRTYSASFAGFDGYSYRGTLSGADFAVSASHDYPDMNMLYASLSGAIVNINFSDPEIWEHVTRETDVSPQTDLAIIGSASGTLQADKSLWSFAATFTYCPVAAPGENRMCTVPEIRCYSTNHQFTLQRRQ